MEIRQQRLRFCKKCKNRLFDRDKGLICSLTNNVADFYKTCPEYIPDKELIQKENEKKAETEEKETKKHIETASIILFILTGIFLIIGVLLWVSYNVLSIIAFFSLLIGLIFLFISFYSLKNKKRALKIALVFSLGLFALHWIGNLKNSNIPLPGLVRYFEVMIVIYFSYGISALSDRKTKSKLE